MHVAEITDVLPHGRTVSAFLACALAVVLAGCASVPGTKRLYAPIVAMQGVDAKSYQDDLSTCRTYVEGRGGNPPSGQGRAHTADERIVMNCMVGRGYVVLDGPRAVPANYSEATNRVAAVATLPPPSSVTVPMAVQGPRPYVGIGRDRYQAEQFARAQGCAATPLARLETKLPGSEVYSVACTSGPRLAVYCEFGQCWRSLARIEAQEQ